MGTPLAGYQQRLAAWSDIQDHLPFLYETVRGYKNPVVIELGVRDGNSTSAFLAAVTEVGGELWSVDVNAPGGGAGGWLKDPRWHFLQADDLSAQARNWLPSVSDVLFIDTIHTCEQALAELQAYGPRVRPGGLILLHDMHLVGEEDAGEPVGEVARAVKAYCGETGLEWSSRPGSYGLGVIRVA